MKVVVIGGTGLIGSKVVEKLKQKGHEAIAAAPNTHIPAQHVRVGCGILGGRPRSELIRSDQIGHTGQIGPGPIDLCCHIWLPHIRVANVARPAGPGVEGNPRINPMQSHPKRSLAINGFLRGLSPRASRLTSRGAAQWLLLCRGRV